jgi:hypothetical protein
VSGVHHSFESFVESIEESADHLALKFATQVGHFWVRTAAAELVESLRASLQTGAVVEILFDPGSLEIVDVIPR